MYLDALAAGALYGLMLFGAAFGGASGFHLGWLAAQWIVEKLQRP